MEKMTLPDSYPRKDCENAKYYACCMCEPGHVYYELRYDACSAAATVGETITGASSGDTGVVVTDTLESGSVAAGTGAGTLELSGVTGANTTYYQAFTDNEALTGSSTFVGVANDEADKKQYGLMYPEGDTVMRDGKTYCSFHFALRFRKKDDDAVRMEIDEEVEQ